MYCVHHKSKNHTNMRMEHDKRVPSVFSFSDGRSKRMVLMHIKRPSALDLIVQTKKKTKETDGLSNLHQCDKTSWKCIK